uniref:Uncharacterized protein n=1 Tax=Romanomermis culicivorax TaxID=13658 RepID=A0A915HZE4_ROMCU
MERTWKPNGNEMIQLVKKFDQVQQKVDGRQMESQSDVAIPSTSQGELKRQKELQKQYQQMQQFQQQAALQLPQPTQATTGPTQTLHQGQFTN